MNKTTTTTLLTLTCILLFGLVMLYGLSTTPPNPEPTCVDHWDWVDRNGEIVLRFETCAERGHE